MRIALVLAASLLLGGCGVDAAIVAASITSAGSVTVAAMALYGEEHPPERAEAEKPASERAPE